MSYSLVIKGDPHVAMIELASRAIAPIGEQLTPGLYETVALVDSPIEPLQRWFAEAGECRDGVGFPNGTLLLFTHHP